MQGRNGAVCVIALAEKGALFDPGPCMYMEKLAVGPAVDPNAVSLDRSIAENLQAVALALKKPLGYSILTEAVMDCEQYHKLSCCSSLTTENMSSKRLPCSVTAVRSTCKRALAARTVVRNSSITALT